VRRLAVRVTYLVVFAAVCARAASALSERVPSARVTGVSGRVMLHVANAKKGVPCRKGRQLEPGDSLWLNNDKSVVWLTMPGVNKDKPFALRGPQWWPMPRLVPTKKPPETRRAGAERGGSEEATYMQVLGQYGIGETEAEQLASLPHNPYSSVRISVRARSAVATRGMGGTDARQPLTPGPAVTTLRQGGDFLIELTNHGSQDCRAWVFELSSDGRYSTLWPAMEPPPSSTLNLLKAKRGPVICEQLSAPGGAAAYRITASSAGHTTLKVIAVSTAASAREPIPMSAWDAADLTLTITPPAARRGG